LSIASWSNEHSRLKAETQRETREAGGSTSIGGSTKRRQRRLCASCDIAPQAGRASPPRRAHQCSAMVLGGAFFDEANWIRAPISRARLGVDRSPEDNARRRERLVKTEPRAPSDAMAIRVAIV
jgi:hypothetical protein